jgi:radical SAM superfamily enzyme YgiQ (UPF0313 family)
MLYPRMDAVVYLADLRHNFSGVLANDCMPLGIGYLKAVMDRELPGVHSRLFAYPDRLAAALEDEHPDVLMLSNYMWNEALSLRFAALVKQQNPSALVVMGGPNLPLEPERQLAFLTGHPQIDLYIQGEGDFLASEVVRQFVAVGKSVRRLGELDIPSSIYRRPDGTLVRTQIWERRNEIDEIPSPWLTGCLDEFFDGKLAPLLETNRGCPFQCTFCVQGVRWYTKVHNFSKERVREEIDYIGARIHAVSPAMGMLRIADSNYGMFERDVELSGYIGEAQRKYGWPTYIDATTGKNRPERIIESLERVNGALVLYQSVQSLDDDTLRNIKRSNISKEAYERVMIHVRGRGLRSLSDLILGLPGETLQSHIGSINRIIDSGTNEMHNFQAMMLKGSELETLASRQQYRFETRFRVLPKNYGIYAGAKVFDMDEIVVATDTMTFDEYLEARTYHLACSFFWNNSWFEDAVNLALAVGIKRAEWLSAVAGAMRRDTGTVGALVAEFVRATREELFPTPEACIEFYSREEKFQQLLDGTIGDNLMYRYRAIASFFQWPAVCRLALEATRRLLLERGAGHAIGDFETVWNDLARYIELKHAHGASPEALLAPAQTPLRYDMPQWIAAGMPPDTRPFRLPAPQEFAFALPLQAARELEAALRVWTPTLKGLTKGVTRIRAAAQVRGCRRISDLHAGRGEAAA